MCRFWDTVIFPLGEGQESLLVPSGDRNGLSHLSYYCEQEMGQSVEYVDTEMM